ncbi:hypothetical protein ACFQZ4_40310 [Catellatospora coxensis]
MRGVVTIATALALPRDFPARSQIVFVAAVVAVVTLLLPGVTLPWLVGRLGLSTGAQRRRQAEREVIAVAQDAGLARLEQLRADGTVSAETAHRLGSGSAPSCSTRRPRTTTGYSSAGASATCARSCWRPRGPRCSNTGRASPRRSTTCCAGWTCTAPSTKRTAAEPEPGGRGAPVFVGVSHRAAGPSEAMLF